MTAFSEQFRNDLVGLTDNTASRAEAFDRFEGLGLPSVRDEAWRYTNLGGLAKKTPRLAATDQSEKAGILLDKAALPDLGGARFVVVNGRLDQALSSTTTDVDGVVINQTAAPYPTDTARALTALNKALSQDPLVIDIAPNVAVTTPITIVHVAAQNDDEAAHPHVQLRLGKGATATVVFAFIGGDQAYWVNAVLSADIGDNANLQTVILYDDGRQALNTNLLRVSQASHSRFRNTALLIGGKTQRHEVIVTVTGQGAETDLEGAALARAGQSQDIYTELNHTVPHGTSRQVFRNVADKGGAVAFQGRVVVAEGAQKTDASQSSRSLLLDRSAEANTKPELEIYADDVKCAHGATVGELDAEALFYLESRGIDQVTAKAMLVEAFVAATLENGPVATFEDLLQARVASWMQQRGGDL